MDGKVRCILIVRPKPSQPLIVSLKPHKSDLWVQRARYQPDRSEHEEMYQIFQTQSLRTQLDNHRGYPKIRPGSNAFNEGFQQEAETSKQRIKSPPKQIVSIQLSQWVGTPHKTLSVPLLPKYSPDLSSLPTKLRKSSMPACNRWWHHCPFIWKGEGDGRKEQDYCEDNAESCWSSCGYIHSYCSNSPETGGGRLEGKGVGQGTAFVAGTYEAITARRISVMYYDVGMAWWEGPEPFSNSKPLISQNRHNGGPQQKEGSKQEKIDSTSIKADDVQVDKLFRSSRRTTMQQSKPPTEPILEQQECGQYQTTPLPIGRRSVYNTGTHYPIPVVTSTSEQEKRHAT
ncbi:hypothetical protein CDAR_498821 [Caerostris darwini]|uniref:Uncharacterized protein n=1 Tax=Caerostris darwini TaxID=1538125 RepID=A0AAV4SKF9_9ARAC|nr:hypothetical protein CDAR_498821 [Caerostris darwini]